MDNFDLIIIGGGPAGLAAAIYGGRARLRTLVIEKAAVGGRAETTREIVNYPGFPSISGPDLAAVMKQHAVGFGALFRTEQVCSVDLSSPVKTIQTRRHAYTAPAVILAAGTEARVLNIPGEAELTGQGVAYCATCDAEFFQNQHVVVVGSGDQGIEESMYIAKFASKVTIVVLHEEGTLDCNRQAAEQAFAHPKLDFIWNSVVTAISGENEVTGVTVKNLKSGRETLLPCGGIFFFVGQIPCSGFVSNQVTCNSNGYILTNDMMETNLPGVYAAGDVREKYLRQVATAVSDGAVAATAAERYIEELRGFQLQAQGGPMLLAFWDPAYQDGLASLARMEKENEAAGSPCRYWEIDVSRKRVLARRFGIALSARHPVEFLLVHGEEPPKIIDSSWPLAAQINQ